MTERTPKARRARTGLAASLALHAALVTAAILSLPHWRSPTEPRSFDVSLVPFPALSQTSRRPIAPRRSPSVASAARSSAPAPLTIPLPPTPAPAAGEDPDARARLTAVLRGSFGCTEEAFAHLSQQERDRCAKWRRAQAKPGLEILAPIEHNKRAWFDATVAARNAPDHIPMGGCFGKPPPHAIKIGPCYVDPPKGPFSEDVDAPPEPEHDPR